MKSENAISTVLPLGLALFEEGLHALFFVRRGHSEGEQGLFVPEALIEGKSGGRANGGLREADRERTVSGNLPCDLERSGLEPRIRHDFVHKPDPKGFGGVDAVAGEGELHRVAEAAEAGQPRAPPAPRTNSQVQVPLSHGSGARSGS